MRVMAAEMAAVAVADHLPNQRVAVAALADILGTAAKVMGTAPARQQTVPAVVEPVGSGLFLVTLLMAMGRAVVVG